MSHYSPDILKVRREAIRWHLLSAINLSRPVGIYTEALLPIVQSVYVDATHQEIRRELDYLEAREMCAIVRDPLDRWSVDLTRTGIDFVEYTIDAQPGVARPRITQG
ncbi:MULTISPECIES: hypothetical protein [unclassified Acidovorax]|uniref:hypothetical protein n=1 Tax=unclassified Acidovorax TaxID=2684926 RepID=UPI0023494700|nr:MULTISPECIES: hypothetical protein [unclassified Acidovorax]WCM88557.1 hypothetical protein M5C98_00375 [Acidovorax sp. NCPPB 3576]GKT22578.1 hypothetical protein AVHM3334_08895 [Acidovorax sp. SUPP3334]